tara:strand:- start:89 stop:652 length:564 start_codon:yes stop_codon:yes gene_type:complete
MEDMSSLQGHFLIASPSMDDPNFRQTVMLMVQHDADGALALVLNRPSNLSVQQAWEQVGSSPCKCDGQLGIGGPCQGPIMALHTRKDVGEKQILPGVFLSVEEENVSWLMRRGAEQIKCYIGYAGWAPGQLEEEIAAGSWKSIPAQLDLVFTAQIEDLWRQVTQTADRDIAYPNLLPHMIPHDPTMN